MSTPQYDAILRRYRRAWRAMTAVHLMVPLAWALAGSLGGKDRLRINLKYIDIWNPFFAVEWLAIVTPALAWALARRGLRRAGAEAVAPHAPYRAAPIVRSSWRISGTFPWLGPATLVILVAYTLCLWLLAPLLWGLSWHAGVDLLMWLPALGVLGLIWLWVRYWRRDAGRVGVLERVRQEDGSHGLVLHTLQGVQHVTIAWAKPSSRRLRLEGSRDVWHAVEPIDDLVDPDFRGAN